MAGNAQGGGALLLGRVTYDLMAAFWPTPAARELMPAVAEGINRVPKYVVTRTLEKPAWNNTKRLDGELSDAVKHLKQESSLPLTILGSGSVAAQLARAGLIDEYQMVVNPIALGSGRTMFGGLDESLGLRLIDSRVFANGNVLLRYQPARAMAEGEERGIG